MKLFRKSGASPMGHHPERLKRFMKWVRRLLLSGLLLFAFAAMIFWDANFYAARDRWENFKIAVFGDWQDSGWCPPGRQAPNCKPRTPLEAALAASDSLHFFKSVPIEGTDLEVVTGANFESADDIVSGRASHHWCYIAYGEGSLRSHLELGSQEGDKPPVYSDLEYIGTTALPALGLARDSLSAIARSHCQLGVFNRPVSQTDY